MLLRAMVGPMVLFTPHMFLEAGVLFAMLSFLLVGALSMLGMLRLVEVVEPTRQEELACADANADRAGAPSAAGGAFALIGYRAAGLVGYVWVEVCVVVSQWLLCVGYPIFVARNLHSLLEALMPSPPPPLTLTLAQLPLLVPYCWVRDLSYLGYPMLAANVCLWSSLVVVLGLVGADLLDSGVGGGAGSLRTEWPTLSASAAHGGIGGGNAGGPQPIEWIFNFGTGTLLFTAQAVLAFEGIALVLPIRASMREPDKFARVVVCCMAISTVAYTLTGFCGYLAYGDDTQTFVTMNIAGPLANAARAAFVLSVLLTYPLQLWPALQALEDRLGLAAPLPSGAGGSAAWARLCWQCLARTCLVCGAFAFSLTAPYANLVGLAGGLCAVPLAFIFPGWFHLALCPAQSVTSKALDWLMIAFGLVMAPVAVIAALVSWR